MNIPAGVLLSQRDQKQNKNDWDRALGMIEDRIHSNDTSLQTIRSFKNQMGEHDKTMNANSLSQQE